MGNDGFVIPKTTINQLNEFSNGGFILFYFNEDGYRMIGKLILDRLAKDSIKSH